LVEYTVTQCWCRYSGYSLQWYMHTTAYKNSNDWSWGTRRAHCNIRRWHCCPDKKQKYIGFHIWIARVFGRHELEYTSKRIVTFNQSPSCIQVPWCDFGQKTHFWQAHYLYPTLLRDQSCSDGLASRTTQQARTWL